MLRRWVAMGFALIPVVFVPTCFGTRALLLWRARAPVAGATAAEFPILVITGKPGHRSVAIVTNAGALAQYRAAHPDATLRSTPAEERQIEELVRGLRALNGVPLDSEVPFRADATLHGGAAHAAYYREVGMGAMWFESWYDTDGTTYRPRYERQYSPTWTWMGAGLLAVPCSFLVSGALGALMLRRPAIRPPNPRVARFVLALLLYAAAAVPLAGLTAQVGIGALIVLASAAIAWVVPWTRRRLIIAFVLLFVAWVIVGTIKGEAAGIAFLCGFGLALLLGTAHFIERSLSLALRIHGTPEAHSPSPA